MSTTLQTNVQRISWKGTSTSGNSFYTFHTDHGKINTVRNSNFNFHVPSINLSNQPLMELTLSGHGTVEDARHV